MEPAAVPDRGVELVGAEAGATRLGGRAKGRLHPQAGAVVCVAQVPFGRAEQHRGQSVLAAGRQATRDAGHRSGGIGAIQRIRSRTEHLGVPVGGLPEVALGQCAQTECVQAFRNPVFDVPPTGLRQGPLRMFPRPVKLPLATQRAGQARP